MAKVTWENEVRKISELVPLELNPRKSNEKQEEDLKRSLDQFNLADPIVINKNNKIIGGHMRIRVLKSQGVKEVDVRVPSRALTDKEERALSLRLNQNKGDWDWDLLSQMDADELLDIGFLPEELMENMEMPLDFGGQQGTKGSKFKSTVVVKKGELFELGRHKLLCGDSAKEEDIFKLMENRKVKLCFIVAPIKRPGLTYEHYALKLKGQKFIDYQFRVLSNAKSVLAGFMFFNLGYGMDNRWEHIDVLYRLGSELRMQFLEIVTWDREYQVPITTDQSLSRQTEELAVLSNEDEIQLAKDLERIVVAANVGKFWFNKKQEKGVSNYWKIPVTRNQMRNAASCIPVELSAKAIRTMTGPGEGVFDPHGFGGSTLIACHQLNRVYYGMENSPKYIEGILDRWEQFSNQQAMLVDSDGTKRSWAEVKLERMDEDEDENEIETETEVGAGKEDRRKH